MSAAPSRGGPLLTIAGGLLVAGAGASGWANLDATRTIGGVNVPAVIEVNGTEFAGLVLPLGLAAVILAALGLAIRGVMRRATGAVCVSLGLAAIIAVLRGLDRVNDGAGIITAAPWLALLGAGMVIAGGLVALRNPRAPAVLDERYTVEGAEVGDLEWELAADERESSPDHPR